MKKFMFNLNINIFFLKHSTYLEEQYKDKRIASLLIKNIPFYTSFDFCKFL